MLTRSKAPFYGIVPGNLATPLGSVIEYIKFEVTDFESSYHAFLGRPALAKFMVVPHYVYFLLKMPGKSGVLTFQGDLKKSYDYNRRPSSTLQPSACQILHQKYS
jgi:hypothetical protein